MYQKSSIKFLVVLLLGTTYPYAKSHETVFDDEWPDCCTYSNQFFACRNCDPLLTEVPPNIPEDAVYVILEGNAIETIPENAFGSVLPSVANLYLEGNNINRIDPSIFSDQLPNVQVLFAHNNALTSVPEELPPNLGYLRLHNNPISEVDSSSFPYLPALDILSLSSGIVHADAFESLSELYMLELDACKLEAYSLRGPPIRSFYMYNICSTGPLKLEPLWLSGSRMLAVELISNGLTNIEENIFAEAEDLENITITREPLLTINPGAFSNLPSLMRVSFNGINPYAPLVFGSDIFRDVPNLEHISFVNTYLYIEDHTFDDLPSLGSLTLQEAQLSTLSPEVLLPIEDQLVKEESINLSRNPWHCDCDFMWLWAFLKRKEDQMSETVKLNTRCAEPEHLADRIIIELTEDDFDCPL